MGAAIESLNDIAWPPLFAATNNGPPNAKLLNFFVLTRHTGHYAAVKLLLEHGANVHYRDRDGNSVLHRAAMNGSAVCLVRTLPSQYDCSVLIGDLSAATAS